MINKDLDLKKSTIKAKKGLTFYELIIDNCKDKAKDIAICKLNGRYHELTEIIEDDGEVEPIGFDTELGIKIYIRTLQFIFIKVALDLFPESKITIDHAISKAVYGEVHKENALSKDDVHKIKLKMQEIIDKDIPIKSIRTLKEDAIEIFEKYKCMIKLNF